MKKAKSPKGGGAKLKGLRRYHRYVSQLPGPGLFCFQIEEPPDWRVVFFSKRYVFKEEVFGALNAVVNCEGSAERLRKLSDANEKEK